MDHPDWARIALMCVLPRPRPGHIAILMVPFHETRPSSWRRRVKRAAVARLVRHGIDRINVPAPLQRQWAGERWRLPPERFVNARWPVDTAFWRPTDEPGGAPRPGPRSCGPGG